MAKTKNTKNKKNTKQKKTNDQNKQILENIENAKDGSPCQQNMGPGCSVDTVQLKKNMKPHKELNLSKEDMLKALRNMMLARYSDEKQLTLLKQGKAFFHIGGSGHEAAQTAIGFSMKPGHDWGWTYYRDSAYMYSLGYKPEEFFMLALAKPDDPATGGRQMPNHYGHPGLNQPTQSSPTGTQFLNGVGTALAARKNASDDLTYISGGEGATSEGEFYEAVNWASREKLPALFHIQDNGYAISVPRERQSMGSTVGHSFCCYANLKMKTFDGTNYFESLKAAREAVEHIRAGKGPVLLHAIVERLLPHSSSDDHRKYRPQEELEQAKEKKDPIKNLVSYLIENELAAQEEIDELGENIRQEISDAIDKVMELDDPKPEDSANHIYAPEETRELDYVEGEPEGKDKAVMVDAIRHAMHEEMNFNDKMLIFGEDIEDPKGGVFTATKGLTDAYGQDRVFNSPLAEASIAGVALGLAVRGWKPVVEIQFGDYIWPAYHQIKNELSTMRYRSNGGFSAPVVIRVPVGGYIHGGLCHSQNIEANFAHIPGLFIAYPSTAADAKGLLKTACRIQDPVLFLEHKGMYRLPYSTSLEPDENYLLPFGKGKYVKRGNDATIVTWGMSCRDSLNAVKKIERGTGKTIEIIDLRTIIPWDREMVLESVAKTNKVMVVHEDTETLGFGAEISAVISQHAFKDLDAPVMRHAGKHSHIPYAPAYEKDVLPNEEKIGADLRKLLEF